MNKYRIKALVNKSLGAWLKNQRRKAGQPLDAAAEHIGNTATELKHVEMGDTPIKFRDFAKLITFYRVPPIKVIQLFNGIYLRIRK